MNGPILIKFGMEVNSDGISKSFLKLIDTLKSFAVIKHKKRDFLINYFLSMLINSTCNFSTYAIQTKV